MPTVSSPFDSSSEILSALYHAKSKQRLDQLFVPEKFCLQKRIDEKNGDVFRNQLQARIQHIAQRTPNSQSFCVNPKNCPPTPPPLPLSQVVRPYVNEKSQGISKEINIIGSEKKTSAKCRPLSPSAGSDLNAPRYQRGNQSEVALVENSKKLRTKNPGWDRKYQVDYLGSLPVVNQDSSLSELQRPLKLLYLTYLRSRQRRIGPLHDVLEIKDSGLVIRHSDGSLYNPFPTIAVWTAVKFVVRKKRCKSHMNANPELHYAFLPLISELECKEKFKLFNALDAGSDCNLLYPHHPPIFVCVMKREECNDLQSLECHGMICTSPEDAIIIAVNLYQVLLDNTPTAIQDYPCQKLAEHESTSDTNCILSRNSKTEQSHCSTNISNMHMRRCHSESMLNQNRCGCYSGCLCTKKCYRNLRSIDLSQEFTSQIKDSHWLESKWESGFRNNLQPCTCTQIDLDYLIDLLSLANSNKRYYKNLVNTILDTNDLSFSKMELTEKKLLLYLMLRMSKDEMFHCGKHIMKKTSKKRLRKFKIDKTSLGMIDIIHRIRSMMTVCSREKIHERKNKVKNRENFGNKNKFCHYGNFPNSNTINVKSNKDYMRWNVHLHSKHPFESKNSPSRHIRGYFNEAIFPRSNKTASYECFVEKCNPEICDTSEKCYCSLRGKWPNKTGLSTEHVNPHSLFSTKKNQCLKKTGCGNKLKHHRTKCSNSPMITIAETYVKSDDELVTSNLDRKSNKTRKNDPSCSERLDAGVTSSCSSNSDSFLNESFRKKFVCLSAKDPNGNLFYHTGACASSREANVNKNDIFTGKKTAEIAALFCDVSVKHTASVLKSDTDVPDSHLNDLREMRNGVKNHFVGAAFEDSLEYFP